MVFATRMRVVSLAALAGLGILLLVLCFLVVGRYAPAFRPCGHRRDLISRLIGPHVPHGVPGEKNIINYVTRHGCAAESVVESLTFLHAGQRDYQRTNGTYASSVADLPAPWISFVQSLQVSGYPLRLRSMGTNWCGYLAKQGDLPGHYLATTTGIYFNENREPTTNDVCIMFLK